MNTWSCFRIIALCTCTFSVIPAPVSARQVITGRVLDAATAVPLAGAAVRLLVTDVPGRAGDVSTTNGAFRLHVTPGAEVRVSASILGYETWTSQPMVLQHGDTVRLTIELNVWAIPLTELRAESGSRCRHAGDLPPLTDALWTRVRTALGAERATRASGSIRFQVETFERDVATDSAVVLREIRRRTTTRDPEAFRSVSIRQLEETGFFDERSDGDYLVGPTASVLLDDWFAATHCLSLTFSTADDVLGIRFQPNSDRRLPEIRGTLWLDAVTLQLRHVDYEYVRLPGRLPAGARGGVVVFDTLRGGGVIVSGWTIRSPLVQRTEVSVFGERRPVERTFGYRENGGEVLRALRGTDTLHRAARGAVVGTAFDSVNLTPLADAEVTLAGTGFRARADSLGRYRIDDVPPGVYRLTFSHPRLAAFGYRPPPARVAVEVHSVATVDLGIPRNERLVVTPQELARLDSILVVGRFLGLNMAGVAPGADRAQEEASDTRPARIVGRVVEHESRAAIGDAEVRLVARSATAEVGAVLIARSDANGHFQLRAVPAGEYDVFVSRESFEPSREDRVTIEPGTEYHWVIRLQRSPAR